MVRARNSGGTENKQILVKHGGSYVRIHQCRLQKYLPEPNFRGQDISESSSENPSGGDINDAELSRELKSDINNDYGELEEVDHEDPLREDSPVPAPISSEAPVSSTSNSPKSSIRRTKIVSKIVLPQVGENILCKLADDNISWKRFTVLSRAGKVTGKK